MSYLYQQGDVVIMPAPYTNNGIVTEDQIAGSVAVSVEHTNFGNTGILNVQDSLLSLV